MRKYDFDTLYDLVRLSDIYDSFLEKFSANPNSNIDQVSVASNGKLTILATLLYLWKKQKGLIENSTSDGVHRDNVKGLLITDYPNDDLEERIGDLFYFIIRKIAQLYDSKKESEKITSYSNFFKSEKMYDLVMRSFDEIENDRWDREKLNDYMKVFLLKK